MNDLSWVAAGCTADAFAAPPDLDWLPSAMPATAASVLAASGLPVEQLDERDWWWQTTLPADLPAGSFLVFDGIATHAEIWVDAELVRLVGGMFEDLVLPVAAGAVVSIRVLSLSVALLEKKPRPRWKARLVAEQRLRWFRTSLTGRMPGFLDGHPAVGPWRGIRLLPGSACGVVSPGVSTSLLPDGDGLVRIRSHLVGLPADAQVLLVVGERRVPVEVRRDTSGLTVVGGSIGVPHPPLWWPHTHGAPHLVEVSLEIEGTRLSLGATGFRQVTADRTDDGFALKVNGCRVFARGACWSPLAPDGTHLTIAAATECLEKLAAAGLNMVRFLGTTAWAAPELLSICDRIGVMVWQDIPMAAMDQPDDAVFAEEIAEEVAGALAAAVGSPSLMVICGGAEIEQQAAMMGFPSSLDALPLTQELARLVPPTLVFVANSPTGGIPAFRVDTGVGQYFGVGAYRRPIEDARRAGVRFAAECFAFAVPPHDRTAACLTTEQWSAGIPRDRGADWDFADVTDFYAHAFFGECAEPEFLRDLHSAAAAECLTALWSEWRRPGSTCSGAVAISLRDVIPGPGWGLLDAAGLPKSTWFAARRVSAPIALLHTDEGLNGLALHVINDAPTPLVAALRLDLIDADRMVESGSVEVNLGAHSSGTFGDVEILGVFRDVTQAYHFGPPSCDLVAGFLVDSEGVELSRTIYLPLGRTMTREADLGLEVTLDQGMAIVSSRLHARGVVVSLDDGDVEDAWFDLLPGETRKLGISGGMPRTASVRALNGVSR